MGAPGGARWISLSPCGCGNGGSRTFRDCPRPRSSGEPHSKPQACPRRLCPPLLGRLSPRAPAWTTPRQSVPSLPSACCKRPHVTPCIRLPQVLLTPATDLSWSPLPALIPQHLSFYWLLLCANHALSLSRPVPPACPLDPSHPVPSSSPWKSRFLVHSRSDFCGFSNFPCALECRP